MSKNSITYLWTWPDNSGNAFIDLGSIQSLKAAAPEYAINQAGGVSRVLFEERYCSYKDKIYRWLPTSTIKSILGKGISKNIKNSVTNSIVKGSKIDDNEIFKNFLDLSLYFNSDFAVLSGCILDWHIIRYFRSTLLKLKNKDVKIIINGGGGTVYNEKVISEVRKLLKKIKPYAFISRDEIAFKHYQDLARYSHNGIDCGFFVNDYFTPVKLKMPEYYAFCFDILSEPKINVDDKQIVRTHHLPFWNVPKKYFDKTNTLFTDLAEDYLNLYANAEAVYTDRVHACVVALSYGTPCRLYHKTSRALLFDRVEAREIEKELTYPNREKIEKEKKNQINFLSEVLQE